MRRSLSLDLGSRSRCLLTGIPTDVRLEKEYDAFLRPESPAGEPDLVLRFFEDPAGTEVWRQGEVIFTCDTWNLRRTENGWRVVGTAFNPPRPFWVAEADATLTDFSIAHLPTPTPVPEFVVVDAALRILARLSLIQNLAGRESGLLVHTAAAEINDRIFLFPGVSGGGKSTFSRLLLDRAGVTLVNDDRMIVARDSASGDGWRAWGTPWPGELEIALSSDAPLGGILFLEKCEQTFVEPIGPVQAVHRLLPVVSVPWFDEGLLPAALGICERLVNEVPTAALHFRPDDSAVEAVLDAVNRGIDKAP